MTDDFGLGVAQLLDNLQRCGIRLVPSGNASLVRAWFEKHQHELTTEKPALASFIEIHPTNIAGRSKTANSQMALPVVPANIADAKSAATLPQLQPPIALGSWTQARVTLDQQIDRLAAQSKLVETCQRCSDLVCSRTRTVYGVGNPATKIVFVGEAPGYEEDKRGEPFVGASGALLDKIILAMGLQREQIYILNAIKCRPANNRTPTDQEVQNCHEYFIEQLEILQPQFVICLGAVASRAVLQTSLGIGKLRGKFHSYRGSKVAVTYHPSYLLRTPDAKKMTWEDMKMVMAELKNTPSSQ